MLKPTLPVNPYISVFDFDVVYDLNTGKIIISLDPSLIQDANGITGVKLEIVTPNNNKIISTGYAFIPSNVHSKWETPVPQVLNTYLYGVYKIKAILVLGGIEYTAAKDDFNLCAVNSTDPMKLEGEAFLDVKSDCNRGIVQVSGLGNTRYKNIIASDEDKNITVFYPTETELSPQRNISQTPFQVQAYVGRYIIKGLNVSTFTFADNVFVKIRFVASVIKDVRCNISLKKLYCAISDLYKKSIPCGDQIAVDVMCETWCRLNPLLWMALVGKEEGLDVSDVIMTLEKELNVDCSCGDCAGTPIAPSSVGACPQVRNLIATINGFVLNVSFSTFGIPVSNLVHIEYRPKGSVSWTIISPDIPATGDTQSVNLNVLISKQYEVRVTTVCGNTVSADLVVTSNDPGTTDCVDITGINATGDTGTTTTTVPATTTIPGATTTVPATTTIPATTTFPGTTTTVPATTTAPLDNIYIGFNDTGLPPTQSEILAGTLIQANGAADVLADYRPFNASAHFLWFAIEYKSVAYEKNHWEENPASNFGNIGGPSDQFGAYTPISVSGKNYIVTITNFQTLYTNIQNPVKFSHV